MTPSWRAPSPLPQLLQVYVYALRLDIASHIAFDVNIPWLGAHTVPYKWMLAVTCCHEISNKKSKWLSSQHYPTQLRFFSSTCSRKKKNVSNESRACVRLLLIHGKHLSMEKLQKPSWRFGLDFHLTFTHWTLFWLFFFEFVALIESGQNTLFYDSLQYTIQNNNSARRKKKYLVFFIYFLFLFVR